MQDEPSKSYAGQHVPFKQEGWGFAFFVVMLAVASATGAWYVHHKTFKEPTDVRFHAAGTYQPSAPTH